jgi:hypothetical protein
VLVLVLVLVLESVRDEVQFRSEKSGNLGPPN